MKYLWLAALALVGSVSAWSASCPVEVTAGRITKAESGTGYKVFVSLKNVSSVAVKSVDFDAIYVDSKGKHFEPATYFSDEDIKAGASDSLEWPDVKFEEKVFAAKTPEGTEFRVTKIELANNQTITDSSECVFKFSH
ncbi:hypothetical protein [Occallatibacter riparius]|uniref:DUF4352 domain-containing protein n=1 Tax=Occallatibacter riparius TaxID=1002689 RepID=A0A9J7BR60_9BACT|nr:hypothetical protein [Occallatibacter riparius]UWZ83565.1 hypothetical protein MOP44_23730 [Occallatibacter riparius]